ncbi:hypothetical protein DAY12_29180 [Bacillus thuringiensis]|nr:hypothetical protein BMT17_26090 [Bacillus thuringiensis serovar kurstaki]PTN41824.1 hypothetical protein DAY12_30315 [Bacillus thuringiensis]PTN42158.1 hypothetical protein DAY12_29180 [Bacillus thuringiensis]
MRACPESKAALELLTSRFEDQAAQPASRESRTFTEKHSKLCDKSTGGIRIVPNDPKTII